MKVCFRLAHDLVEHDTGRALLFRLPNSYNDTVWVPWFLTDSYGCKKFGYLIEVAEDFQFTVKQGDDEVAVKMTPKELIDAYKLERDEEKEEEINEEEEERKKAIEERKEKEEKAKEENKDKPKDWSKVKVRCYEHEYVGDAVKMSVKYVDGIITCPSSLCTFFKKTVQMPRWLADEKQIPAFAQKSTVHVPETIEVVENQKAIDELVISD